MLVQGTRACADTEAVTKASAKVNVQANTHVKMAVTVVVMHSMKAKRFTTSPAITRQMTTVAT